VDIDCGRNLFDQRHRKVWKKWLMGETPPLSFDTPPPWLNVSVLRGKALIYTNSLIHTRDA
jgi:hypothetical protein